MLSEQSKMIYRRGFVLGALGIVLILFLFLIRSLVITVVLAATFSGLLLPLRVRLQHRLKGRRTLATVIVFVCAVFVIGIPFLTVLAVSAKQAIQVSESVVPHIQEYMNQPPEEWIQDIMNLPLIKELQPYQSKVVEGFSELLQTIAGYFSRAFTTAAFSAMNIIFKLLIGFYTAFFFLKDGDGAMDAVKEYVPLTMEELKATAGKGLIIFQATMKSLLVIGVIQGALIALAFWVLGIPAPVFWGVIVAVLSAIPGLGAPFIWVPAVIYLLFTGQFFAAGSLILWGVLPVGLTDNFLRPLLIGKDVDLPEVYVLLSILGGIATLGISGIIVGPLLASLLISVLEIYRKVFQPIVK